VGRTFLKMRSSKVVRTPEKNRIERDHGGEVFGIWRLQRLFDKLGSGQLPSGGTVQIIEKKKGGAEGAEGSLSSELKKRRAATRKQTYQRYGQGRGEEKRSFWDPIAKKR